MPGSSPFHSTIPPYSSIRVDNFTKIDAKISLYLLTHAHSDHLLGLASKGFNSNVLCTYDTKQMVLYHEMYADRSKYDHALAPQRVRQYGHLQILSASVPGGSKATTRDLLTAIPINEATTVETADGEHVKVTPINANHCPGSAMFLIEGSKGAVLHTGDVRAEPSLIYELSSHMALKPYIPSNGTPHTELQAIYLDTASIYGARGLPSKRQALVDLIAILNQYPPDQTFFINVWTWGYEEILKAIAGAFDTLIHVDRYKYEICRRLSDPILKAILTTDEKSTRFHACERFDRCTMTATDRAGVIYVNPVVMGKDSWSEYVTETKKTMSEGSFPPSLSVAVARHSTLDELQSLVALFRPMRVIPNDLNPALQGRDWLSMIGAFGPSLSEGGVQRMYEDVISAHPHLASRQARSHPDDNIPTTEQDVAVDNLVAGSEGVELVQGRLRSSMVNRKTKLQEMLQETEDLVESFSKIMPQQQMESKEVEDPLDSPATSEAANSDDHHKIHRRMTGIFASSDIASSSPSSPAKRNPRSRRPNARSPSKSPLKIARRPSVRFAEPLPVHKKRPFPLSEIDLNQTPTKKKRSHPSPKRPLKKAPPVTHSKPPEYKRWPVSTRQDTRKTAVQICHRLRVHIDKWRDDQSTAEPIRAQAAWGVQCDVSPGSGRLQWRRDVQTLSQKLQHANPDLQVVRRRQRRVLLKAVALKPEKPAMKGPTKYASHFDL